MGLGRSFNWNNKCLCVAFCIIICTLCYLPVVANLNLPDGAELCNLACSMSEFYEYSHGGNNAFCQYGCSLFFSSLPNNNTCAKTCDHYYRYETTCGLNEIIENGMRDCRAGCTIASEVCQAGYNCQIINGANGTKSRQMIECPLGTYRTSPTNITQISPTYAAQCIGCPYGTYRDRTKGKTVKDCALCPTGKYLNATGSTSETDCLSCPAGMVALLPGQRFCECITPDSCDLTVTIGNDQVNFYKNGIDYFRETVPFIGR